MYFTHWLLFFKPFRIWFQNKKVPGISKTTDIRPYCTILGTKNVIIGERVIIPAGTLLSNDPDDPNSKIIIEDDVLFGPNVSIYSCTHLFNDRTKPIKDQGHKTNSVLLKKGCCLGINTVIMPGITIGINAVIGANSVVPKDVPDYAVVVGSPAKIIKYIDE
jgi:acetyltransferase-like isoleucine patch superfamily enzyme